MPKYRATVKCFIDNTIREEGEIFEYSGPQIEILTPVDGVEKEDHVAVEPERRKPGRPRKAVTGADSGMD